MNNTTAVNSCVKYDFELNKWSPVTNMNAKRYFAASTVYEGKITISGGLEQGFRELNSVEAYDHEKNSWSSLPEMIETRSLHNIVSLGNKLFAIGGSFSYSWEAFDCVSRDWTLINHRLGEPRNHRLEDGVCCINDKVVLVSTLSAGQFEFTVCDHRKEKIDKVARLSV